MIAAQQPTHAGGVVYRTDRGTPEILLVTARRRDDVWVFPKGHIERGEAPAQAAVREVQEESGVTAAIVEPLEDLRLRVLGEDQIIRYFLMRVVHDGAPGEGRRSLWLTPAAARERLSFDEARGSLRKALDSMRARGLM